MARTLRWSCILSAIARQGGRQHVFEDPTHDRNVQVSRAPAADRSGRPGRRRGCRARASPCIQPPRSAVHHDAPKVDGTDFYMFRSYEPGRAGYVTLIANYQPLQDPYGGPNYFSMDPNALYEIHIDNNGDASEDITFQFRFKNNLKGITLPIGDKNVAIPLIQAGAGGRPQRRRAERERDLHRRRHARRPPHRPACRRSPTPPAAAPPSTSRSTTSAPRRFPTTPAYAAKHIYSVNIPGCTQPGKMFVGQRKEPFAVNLGTIFDLVNAPVGGDHQPGADQRRAQHHRRRQHHHAGAGGAQELPDARQRAGDRRLDHGQPAPGLAARPDAAQGPPDHRDQPAARGCRCRAWACRWSTKW